MRAAHFVVFGFTLLVFGRRAGEVENNAEKQSSEFCYVNHFYPSEEFRSISITAQSGVTKEFLVSRMHLGQPFAVSGVTEGWGANSKWNHSHFEEIFQDHELFASTFATDKAPQFSAFGSVYDIYFGIFFNDRKLAELVAADYDYPTFIPAEWRLTGNEWLHWGFPPCGAKRHMDLMCTSRISVQVKGTKQWRLYPLLDGNELKLGNWSEMLQQLEITLHPGEALVWFPGWEHETKILTGPSISLSLHFKSPKNSLYTNTFSETLTEKVSNSCRWKNS